MFYIDEPDLTRLRFGDVIQGFIGTVPVIENPLNPDVLQGYKYQIKFFIPEFSVIMTHCCSIGKGNLALAPLQKIHHKILLNRLNSAITSLLRGLFLFMVVIDIELFLVSHQLSLTL